MPPTSLTSFSRMSAACPKRYRSSGLRGAEVFSSDSTVSVVMGGAWGLGPSAAESLFPDRPGVPRAACPPVGLTRQPARADKPPVVHHLLEPFLTGWGSRFAEPFEVL